MRNNRWICVDFSGLLMFSLVICDIIERFTEADTVIMGDVRTETEPYSLATITSISLIHTSR